MSASLLSLLPPFLSLSPSLPPSISRSGIEFGCLIICLFSSTGQISAIILTAEREKVTEKGKSERESEGDGRRESGRYMR